MPEFIYTALNRKHGNKVKGITEAEDKKTCKQMLHRKGLVPLSLKQRKDVNLKGRGSLMQKKKLSKKQKMLFLNGLKDYLDAGISPVEALSDLSSNMAPNISNIIKKQRNKIINGASFSESLDPKNFDEVERNIIKVGEQSGRLPMVIGKMAERLEKNIAIRKKIITALSYPVFTLIVLAIAVVIMMKKVFPQIKDTILSIKPLEQLPLTTQRSFAVMGFIEEHYLIVMCIILGIIIASFLMTRFHFTRKLIQRVTVRLPLIKRLVKVKEMINFSNLMNICLDSGINITHGVYLIVNSATNVYYKTQFYYLYNMLTEGQSLSEGLKILELDPFIYSLTKTGEQTGKLAEMMGKGSDYYEKALDSVTKTMVEILPLFFIIIVGIVVGYLIINMIMPIFDITQTIG